MTLQKMNKGTDLRGRLRRGPALSGAVLVMGASGIIAQLLLLRELLITFLSNELSIGVILANWLVLEAAGAYLAGRGLERLKNRVSLFVAVTLAFSLAFPAAVCLARVWKEVAGSIPGEGMGLHHIFLASFTVLLPVSLTHGALFTLACRLDSGPSGGGGEGIGRIYCLETVGTLAGGLVFTLGLITFMGSVQTAFAVSMANAAACLFLLRFASRDNGASSPDAERPPRSEGAALAASALLLGFTAAAFLAGVPERLHRFSITTQWRGQEVVHYENSVYGNTAVIERGGEYTFFSNGIPAITVPTPDVAFVEEFAHLPLLHHPRPEEVLVISGGAGGVISEILKHPVTRVDYAELDPLVLELLKRFPTALTEAELGDPRVHVHYRDGRLLLKETPRRYDMILVGLSDPQDLQINRFFTRQFFSLAGKRLKAGGILAFTVPGSLTYMGPELRDLNACILNTLRDVFPSVRVLPGDGANLMLASPSEQLGSCNVECVEERFRQAAPAVRFLSAFQIRYRLDRRWSRWYSGSLEGGTGRRNEDFTPFGVYFSLSHWNAKFAPRLQGVLAGAGRLSLPPVAGAIAFAGIILVLLSGRLGEPRRMSVPVAIVSTGFAGMLLDLALMFTFQSLYGVVFYWVGLLVTAFMAGSAAGSLTMTRVMGRLGNEEAWFLGIEAALTVFTLLLPAVFLGLEPWLSSPGISAGGRGLFLVLSFISGVLIGMEFPLAGRMYLKSSADVGGTAGLLYGADLIGGWAGGIAGGVVLFPVLGLVQTCLVLGTLKAVSMVLCAVSFRPSGSPSGVKG